MSHRLTELLRRHEALQLLGQSTHDLGFQLKISVMGVAVDASAVSLIRKRPSRETAY
jgi:hypothetical protein